jgi:ElaB/YqjD/DUF883 family membrane-anchored ribosome-binding protein
MNPCTTPAADEKVLAARANLKSRLMALENRVTATVDGACETVDEAAQAVRSSVEHTTGTVRGLLEDSKETLTDALDVRRQIREHPWGGTGLAVVAGFLVGVLATRPSSPKEKVVAEPRRGPLGELLDFARRELTGVAEAAIAAAATSLRKNVEAVAVNELQEPWKSRSERARSSNGAMHANGQSL